MSPHRIAYTEIAREDDPSIRTLLFHAPFDLLKATCQKIYKMMDGRIKNIILRREHSCRVRNGKSYWRVAVKIIALDEQFISFKEFVLMLLSWIQRLSYCKIRHYRTETFLNL